MVASIHNSISITKQNLQLEVSERECSSNNAKKETRKKSFETGEAPAVLKVIVEDTGGSIKGNRAPRQSSQT